MDTHRDRAGLFSQTKLALMYENKNRSSSFAFFLSNNIWKVRKKWKAGLLYPDYNEPNSNEWPEKEKRLIWSYFLFTYFFRCLFCRINSGENWKMELLAIAVMDECESHETLKTNRNSPNSEISSSFIFSIYLVRACLLFLVQTKEHTDAHLLFMRQTYLRSFHFFSFKFQQRKNVAAQLSSSLWCTAVSFILWFQILCSLIFTWFSSSGISLALMKFWRGPTYTRQVVCIPSLESRRRRAIIKLIPKSAAGARHDF